MKYYITALYQKSHAKARDRIPPINDAGRISDKQWLLSIEHAQKIPEVRWNKNFPSVSPSLLFGAILYWKCFFLSVEQQRAASKNKKEEAVIIGKPETRLETVKSASPLDATDGKAGKEDGTVCLFN